MAWNWLFLQGSRRLGARDGYSVEFRNVERYEKFDETAVERKTRPQFH
jgi:hypothetical protein